MAEGLATTPLVDSAAQFANHKYTILRSVLAPHVRDYLLKYSLDKSRLPSTRRDASMVPDTPWVYGDPTMDALLEVLRPRFAAAVGIDLWPTYSFFRVYKHGDVLKRHIDRPACEISVTISLGYSPDTPWPIWFDGGHGAYEAVLRSGDAAIYRGQDLAHWRDTFPGEYAAQVFLHYVNRNGPNREWRYDKRTNRPGALQRCLVQAGLRMCGVGNR